MVEAAAITGHASLKELQRYIETRDRKRAAQRAMIKLISGTEVATPLPGLRLGRKKRDGSTAKSADGSPGRIRTSDQPVNSRLLYH